MASITKLTKAQLISKIDELSSNYAELSEKFEALQSAYAELQAARPQAQAQAKPAPKPMTLAEQTEVAVKAQAAIQGVARKGIRVWVSPASGGMFTFRHCPEGQTPRITRLMTRDDLVRTFKTYRGNAAKTAPAPAPKPQPAEAMSHLA